MEQMREALEGAGFANRREAMEKAFDSLNEDEGAGGSTTPTSGADSGGTGGSDTTTRQGRASSEPVVKPSSEDAGTRKAEPLEKPVKPLAKTGTKPTATPKPGEKPAIQAKPDGEQPQKPAAGAKAPQSWKPELREKWSSLDPSVQAEISRRETEITRALNESASARRFGGEFYKTIQPFEHLMRASGVTPLQAVSNLVTTAASLQTGTPAQKATVVANICKAYGVDLRILDQVLAGQTPKPGEQANDQLLQTIDQRLRPVTEFMQRIETGQRQTSERTVAEVQQEAEAFASDPENEFFEDLRADIGDILELAANRGRSMTLKEAYDRACQQNPDIAKVLKERSDAAAAAEKAKNFSRARRAAVSEPSGTPGGIGGGGKSNLANRRDAISKAWDDLSAA